MTKAKGKKYFSTSTEHTFYRLHKHSFLSLCSRGKCSSLQPAWECSAELIPDHSCLSCTGWSQTGNAIWQALNMDSTSLKLLAMLLFTTALVTPAHLYQSILLAHAQLASSDSHTILAELTSSQPHGLQLCSHRGLTHPTTQPCILSLMNCRRSLPVHSSGLFISGRYLCPEVRAVWWWLQSQCRYYVIVLLYIPSPLLGHS